MAVSRARGAQWLRDQLPGLVASGVISPDTARALEQHYAAEAAPPRNLAFLLLATIGSGLVAAGIILLVAHNWDELSRPTRVLIALLPLICAQLLVAFVLLRRNESTPWRESAAIFNVAMVGTAMSLVSQTYQIHGSLAGFIVIWMLLGLPIVYLLRTGFGAAAYLIGAATWLLTRGSWSWQSSSPMLFWLLLLLIGPYFALLYWRARHSGETTALSVVLAVVAGLGLGFTASFTSSNLVVLAFAGFFTFVYLCGTEFFRPLADDGLHPLASLGAVAIAVLSIVLTFEDVWGDAGGLKFPDDALRWLGFGIEAAFPVGAIALAAGSLALRRQQFSFLAAGLPLATGIAWLIALSCREPSNCARAAAIFFDLYALALGVELISRGLRARSTTRTNFGLVIIAALAVARFFDTDLSFVVRAIGFIVIGLGFLFTNLFLFKRHRAA